MSRPSIWKSVLVAAVLLPLACHDAGVGPTGPVGGTAAAVQAIAGGNVTSPVGSALPDSIAVRVVDQAGNGVAGVVVVFAAAGGGTASPSSTTTGATGVARTKWTLGSAAGLQSLVVQAGGSSVPALTITATALPAAPAQLTKTSGDQQTAVAGSPVPLVVLLADAFGNPVAGVSVTWQPTVGGGSVTPTTSVTDPTGHALTTWTLGAAGTNQVTAVVSAITTTFVATATQPAPTAPAAPSALIAGTTAPTQIDLSWQDNSTTETAFEVESRVGGSSTWTNVATLAANTTTFHHTGLTAATLYGYRVRACTGTTCSAYTVEATATTSGGAGPPVASVTLAPPSASLDVGTTVTLVATMRDAGGTVLTGRVVTFQSSDSGVATFTGLGVVRAIRMGQATITATSEGVSAQALVTVTDPSITPPTAPTSLVATAVSTTQINLIWQDNSTTEAAFQLEGRVGPSTVWTFLNSYAPNTTSLQATGLVPATLYSYRVRACQGTACSAYTNEASATTLGGAGPPGAPTVTPLPAQVLSPTSVAVGGTVVPNSLATTAWMEYGTSPTLAGSSTTPVRDAGSGTGTYGLSETLSGLTTGTTYYYRVVAQNSAGQVQSAILSVRPGVPNPATAVLVSEVVAQLTVTVNWTHDGANGVTGFTVYQRPASGGTRASVGTVAAGIRTFVDATYAVDTTNVFIYEVDACNPVGCAAPAVSSSVATSRLESPTNLAVTGTTTNTATVSWTNNAANASGFFIEYHLPNQPFQHAGTPSAGPAATNYLITGLATGQTYTFRLRAEASNQRPSLPSNEVVAIPGGTGPTGVPTVTALAAQVQSATTVALHGQVVPNGLATTAWIQYGTSPTLVGSSTTAVLDAGAGTAAFGLNENLFGLTTGTTYYYRVVAQNSAGQVQSAILSVRPGVPNPATVVLVSEAPAQLAVTVSWTHDGANGVTGFTVYRRPASGGARVSAGTVAATIRSFVDQGYPVDTTNVFIYEVDACNNVGCAASAVSTSVATSRLEPPTNLAATGTTANTATVSWTNNAANASGFFIEYHLPNQPFQHAGTPSAGPAATSYLITGLVTGQTYTFRLRAEASNQRPSLPSNEVVAVPGGLGPPAAPAVTVAAPTGVNATSVTVGGTVVPNSLATTAWVEYGTSPTLVGSSTTPVRNAGAGTSTYTFTETLSGLTTGTTYYYRVVAQNSAAQVQSAILSVRPGAPNPATAVLVSEVVAQLAVNVNWTHDGANGVTDFTVYRRPASGGARVSAGTVPGSLRTYLDAGYAVDATNAFIYEVEACNAAGCAAPAVGGSVSTSRLEPPTNLAVTGTTTGSATVTWTNNAPNAGGFSVDFHTPGGFYVNSGQAAPAGATSFTITGLGNGQTYYFQLRARTPNGRASLPSNEVIVVPGGGGAPAAPTVVPSAQVVSATSVTIGGQVTPNNLVTSAWVEYGTSPTLAGSSTTPVRQAGAGAVYTVSETLTGLTTGTTYYYRLVAQNSAGQVQSSIQSVLPAAVNPATAVQVSEVVAQLVVNVSWTHDGANGVTGFTVYRRPASGGGLSPVGTVAGNVRTFVDATYPVDAPNAFIYEVAACSPSGCATRAVSAPIATSYLVPPSNFAVTGTSAATNSATVTWSYSGAIASGFAVFFHTPGGLYTTSGQGAPAGATSLVIHGLGAGQTYYFELHAQIGSRFSLPSNEVITVIGGGGPPAVPTVVPSAQVVSATSVTVGGLVTPNNLLTTAWVEYGTSPTLAGSSTTPVRQAGAGAAYTVSETLTGLTTGTTYYYRLGAQNSAGQVQSSIQSVRPAAVNPVTAVQVTELLAQWAVNVSWTHDGANGVTGFTVYRRPASGGGLSPVGSVAGNVTSYVDASYPVDVTNTFIYEVEACGPSGCSVRVASPPIATSRLEPLTNLAVTGTTSYSATVAWLENAPAGGFIVDFHLAGQTNFGPGPQVVSAGVTSYTITGLGSGLTYTFRVRARTPNGRGSLPSNEVVVAIP
ncbi:MAG: fibronectin type III domain-containing protein [bacterium]